MVRNHLWQLRRAGIQLRSAVCESSTSAAVHGPHNIFFFNLQNVFSGLQLKTKDNMCPPKAVKQCQEFISWDPENMSHLGETLRDPASELWRRRDLSYHWQSGEIPSGSLLLCCWRHRCNWRNHLDLHYWSASIALQTGFELEVSPSLASEIYYPNVKIGQ